MSNMPLRHLTIIYECYRFTDFVYLYTFSFHKIKHNALKTGLNQIHAFAIEVKIAASAKALTTNKLLALLIWQAQAKS